ncbi:hypothetical protein, partial [Aeromonas media]|uniref:hypothetical protein n=1 Tax=Aeromonas media TaxID=651 RepID=UPI001C58E00B
ENGALTPFQAFGQANIRSSRPVVAGSRLKVCDGLRGTVSPAANRDPLVAGEKTPAKPSQTFSRDPATTGRDEGVFAALAGWNG